MPIEFTSGKNLAFFLPRDGRVLAKLSQGDLLLERPLDQNGDPTPAEIFRVFLTTTVASIEGLKLLLGECADLRAELVTIRDEQAHKGEEFSLRQQKRILQLNEAAQELQSLLASLPSE